MSITRSVVSIVAAIMTIVFLTIFILLEGRAWMDRIDGCSPSARRRAGGRSGTTFLDLIPLAGATLAGILGALAAIPVAGAIGVIPRDPFAHRRGRRVETLPGVPDLLS